MRSSIASFEFYEDIKKKKGNAAKMMECLSRNRMEEAALKKVLSVSDCEESVYLLESYLGCPIFGITDECPPIHAPDRTLFHSCAGGKSNVAVKLQQNHASPRYTSWPCADHLP